MIRDFHPNRDPQIEIVSSGNKFSPLVSAAVTPAGPFGSSRPTLARFRFEQRMTSQSPLFEKSLRLMGFVLFCLLFSIGISSSAVYAQTSVRVAVNGQDETEKNDAYRVALRWAFQKRDGAGNRANSQAAREALRDAGRYVDGFNFISADDGEISLASLPVTRKVRDSGKVTHVLTVNLSDEAIDAALRDPLMTAEGEAEEDELEDIVYSSALVWLLIDDAGREIQVGNQSGQNIVDRMREIAGGAGWNLFFPELDTLDLSLIGPDEYGTKDEESYTSAVTDLLLGASQRYSQALVVSAIIKRSLDGPWEASWSRRPLALLETQSKNSQGGAELNEPDEGVFSSKGISLDAALENGIGWLAGRGDAAGTLSSADPFSSTSNGFTSSSLSGNEAKVWIGNVNSIASYAKVLRSILDLGDIESVQPVHVRNDGMLLSVKPRGALQSISAMAIQQNWLSSVTSASDDGAAGSTSDVELATEQSTDIGTPAPAAKLKADLRFEIVR